MCVSTVGARRPFLRNLETLRVPAYPSDFDRPQCCQAAVVNHALFLFVRAGAESGGVPGGGGGHR